MTISSLHREPYLYQRYIDPFLESNGVSDDPNDAETVLKIIQTFSPLEAKILLVQAQKLFRGSIWPTNQKISLLRSLTPHSSLVRQEHIKLTLMLSGPGEWTASPILSALEILLKTDTFIKRGIVLETLEFAGNRIKSASKVIRTLQVLKKMPYLDRSKIVSQLRSNLPQELSLKIANRFLKLFKSLVPIERQYIVKELLIESALLFITSDHSTKEIEEVIRILNQIDPSERKPKINLVKEWIAEYEEYVFTPKEQNEILDIVRLFSLESVKVLFKQTNRLFLKRNSLGADIIKALRILCDCSFNDQEELIQLTLQTWEPKFWFSWYTLHVLEILSQTTTRKELIQDLLPFVQKFPSSISLFDKADTLELLIKFPDKERPIILSQLVSQLPENLPLRAVNVFLKLLILLEPKEKKIFFQDHFILDLISFFTPHCWEAGIGSAFQLLAKIDPLERPSLIASFNQCVSKKININSKNDIFKHYLTLSSDERDLLKEKIQNWDSQKESTEAAHVIFEISSIKTKRGVF